MSTLSEVCETLVNNIKADMKRLDDDQHHQRAPIGARPQSLLHKPGHNFGGLGSAGGGGAFLLLHRLLLWDRTRSQRSIPRGQSSPQGAVNSGQEDAIQELCGGAEEPACGETGRQEMELVQAGGGWTCRPSTKGLPTSIGDASMEPSPPHRGSSACSAASARPICTRPAECERLKVF